MTARAFSSGGFLRNLPLRSLTFRAIEWETHLCSLASYNRARVIWSDVWQAFVVGAADATRVRHTADAIIQSLVDVATVKWGWTRQFPLPLHRLAPGWLDRLKSSHREILERTAIRLYHRACAGKTPEIADWCACISDKLSKRTESPEVIKIQWIITLVWKIERIDPKSWFKKTFIL